MDPWGKPYLVGHQEFAALYGVEPHIVSQWLSSRRRVLAPSTALVVSGLRYWPLGFAARFGAMADRFKQVDVRVKARLVAEQGRGWEPDLGHELPPIVGQHEIVQLFGLKSQANLTATISSGRFPPADWRLSGSKLWLLETVIEAVPHLQARARTVPWTVDEGVAEALREGTYDGPGSRVASRGPYARKGL